MKFRRNEVDIKKFTIDKEKIEKFKDDMSYMNIIPKDFSKKRLKSCPICVERSKTGLSKAAGPYLIRCMILPVLNVKAL